MSTHRPLLRRLLGGAASLLIVGFSTACENSVEPEATPRPGSALVSLAQAEAGDGGMSFTVTGTGILNVRATGTGYEVYWRLVSAQELRVIVLGRMAAGPLVSIDVADMNKLPDFRATVAEVSSQTGAAREQPGGYRVTVEAPAAR